MNDILILWISIAVIALVIDIITSSFLFVWFTIGAIAAIVGQILNFSFIAQIIIFMAATIVSMIGGYPIVKKKIKNTVKYTPLREETYIGKELTVDENMINSNSVKVDGVYWKMRNAGDEIKYGDKVKIVSVEGNKILIKKIKGEC